MSSNSSNKSVQTFVEWIGEEFSRKPQHTRTRISRPHIFPEQQAERSEKNREPSSNNTKPYQYPWYIDSKASGPTLSQAIGRAISFVGRAVGRAIAWLTIGRISWVARKISLWNRSKEKLKAKDVVQQSDALVEEKVASDPHAGQVLVKLSCEGAPFNEKYVYLQSDEVASVLMLGNDSYNIEVCDLGIAVPADSLIKFAGPAPLTPAPASPVSSVGRDDGSPTGVVDLLPPVATGEKFAAEPDTGAGTGLVYKAATVVRQLHGQKHQVQPGDSQEMKRVV